MGGLARGGLAVTRYLGIRSAAYGRAREYQVFSREARNAIRGTSNDLVLFDEVRTQVDLETWAAVEPTTSARPGALILGISTAGSDRSVLLRDWYDRGLRIVAGAEPANGFGMTWYAPADSLAPDDPRAWLAANPSIADGRMDPVRIRESIAGLGPAAFRTERLNLWADAVDEWLPPGLWDLTAAAQPDPAGARIALGVDVPPSWRRATVSIAYLTDAGAWVGIAGELDASLTLAATVSPADLAALLDRVARDWAPGTVAYSASAAAAPAVAAWAERARVRAIALGPREVAGACELFRSELIGRRLGHAPHPLLARQARAARPNAPIESGRWFLSVPASRGDIDAIRAATWAAWSAIAPPEPVAALNIHV